MKKKTKIDFEVVRKLLFPENQSEHLNLNEVAQQLCCTRDDIVKSMKEWTSKRTYNSITRKWE